MPRRSALVAATVVAVLSVASIPASASALSFKITPLLRPDGSSEESISYNSSGLGVVTALSWTEFGTNTWLGDFGTTPSFVGQFDAGLAPGVGGGGDADSDLGSTGTLHLTSLVFFFNPATHQKQLGVSAVTCPSANVSNDFANCTSQIIDTTQADRPWITSRGKDVWISYHDSGNSTLVHVQRSTDDGLTWQKVGDPITGNGPTTGGSTFDSQAGPIVADPSSKMLYDIYTYGKAGIQKATTTNFNNVAVARSSDGGVTWSTTTFYTAPVNTAEDNIFESLAVDPSNGALYATWSDQAHIFISKSTNHGVSWSSPKAVNVSPVRTAVMPWVAARNGVVDVVYYGTNVAGVSDSETTASWNVYLARSTDAGSTYSQIKVTPQPNHVGVICTQGIVCADGTRNLLDLFEVAIDPVNGKIGIAYTDDTLTTDSSGNPLPQAVLAQQT
jgi:hypothetical protein